MEEQATSGLNAKFGFHMNRPFYIQSRLPMKRVAEAKGNNNISLMRYTKNRAAQKWVFDGVSKTIRNDNWKNYYIEIPSNGGANNLKITGTKNSRWW